MMEQHPQSTVEEMEAQHRELLAAVERFDASQGAPDGRMRELLNQLEAYVRDHFGFEERAMAITGYPNLAGHIAAHQEVRAKVHRAKSRYAAEGSTSGVLEAVRDAVAALLHDQMVMHDRALSAFLREQAKSAGPRLS